VTNKKMTDSSKALTELPIAKAVARRKDETVNKT
jgi:hypothetical protein